MTTDIVSLGFSAVDWIEHYLIHGPGDVQDQPIELDDEFAAFVVKAYRLQPRTGARLVRRAFLSRSKGRAKSELAAMIACFEALGPCRFDHWAAAGEVSDWGYEYEPGEPVGKPVGYVEILNVATEEGQAGHTYDNVRYMLDPESCSVELLDDYGRIDVGLTRTNLPGRRGSMEPVTAANESKDGAKSTFIVADETHLWTPPAVGKFKLGKMHQTMVRNLLKRKVASGWMLETSTMYAEGEGSVAEGTHAYAKTLAKTDHRLLFDHRQASVDHDLEKRQGRIAALREAYGPAADWMDLPELAAYWDDPQATHAEFCRFWLNQPVPLVESSEDFFGAGMWEAGKTKRRPPYEAPTFAVARDMERAWTSLGYAEAVGDHWHLAPVDRRRGTHWLAAKVTELHEKFPAARWVIATTGPASALIDDVEAIVGEDKILRANSGDLCDASSDIYDYVQQGRIEHRAYPELDESVRDAKWRTVVERMAIGRKNSDASMLEAVALALWGTNQPVEVEQAFFGSWR